MQPTASGGQDGATNPSARAPVPWGFLAALSLVKLGLYALTSGPLAYGHMSDELYYLDCAERLAWGYVDHPPASIAVLAAVRTALGDSLLALRCVPALAGCATLVLTAWIAREVGGGRTAQRLAALAALAAPLYLALAGFYSMNAFEPALWAAAALLVARIVNGGDRRWWLALGSVVGLGLMNKISMSWFGLGLAAGLVLTPQRRWLATPWPWLAGAVALAIFTPHLLWQAQHDWPTLEFMRNATREKMIAKSPLALAADQLLVMGPAALLLWLAGLVYFFADAQGRRYRILGWIWLAVFLLLAGLGSARSNYLGPAYPALLAGGGVAFERLARRRPWRWLPAATGVSIAAVGLGAAPLALPLLAPERYVAYERALGISAPVEQVDELGALPIHFALRFGWRELVAAVAEAHDSLPEAERSGAAVLGVSFGDTAAVNFFGAAAGLPRAISGHNNYWLWGPGDATGEVLLALAPTDERLRRWYREVERVAEVDCRYCMPDVDRLAVFVCRGLRRPWREIWPELKRYM